MPFYYVYALKSKKDQKLYIGYTENINKRLQEHNQGLVKSTNNRRPLSLVYFEGCLSKAGALIREKSLKTGFGRAYLKRRIV